MMLLSTQLFGDKSGNQVYIRWLPFVAKLDEMGSYSWASATLAWLYRCIVIWALRLSVLDFMVIWESYAALDVLAVVHLEILAEEHSRLFGNLMLRSAYSLLCIQRF
ncbi:hypothetical protein Ahy_A08g040385 [Arachis hypogaea]|uniref:Aminotransferase-like plant mobile domain-containing protein n=1 Tax=Arachis hypogaea TaxID=3818 RepID=A0A445BZE2_ARAHY|nr:hypothetical protein Ahy_A08g040385 [Arachis hypogaea]